MKVTFYLNNGHSFVVWLEKLTRQGDGFTPLTNLEWTSLRSELPQLFYVCLEGISAIVVEEPNE